jgi:carbamoyltransferase
LWAALESGDARPSRRVTSLSLGLESDVETAVVRARAAGLDVTRDDPGGIALRAARLLARGDVGGWFRGRDELGPRALGNRSIVARADSPAVAARTNRVKGREAWRPLAPAVLADDADALGLRNGPADRLDFMIEARRPTQTGPIAGAVHADGSTRPLVVDGDSHPFDELLHAVREEWGVAAVINTSFNVAGEPIVHSPLDALRTFGAGDLDFLAFADALLVKRDSRRLDQLASPKVV